MNTINEKSEIFTNDLDTVSDLGKKSVVKILDEALKKKFNVYAYLKYLNRTDSIRNLDDIEKYFKSGKGENFSTFLISKNSL